MNAPLTKRDSLETESEMLPQDPPPWIIRFSSQLLIVMFLLALLVAVFVHLPETVHCPFVLVPNEGADPIQSPRMATVSRVAVTEGQTVNRGALLFVLRSDEIRGLDTESRTLTQDLHTREESLIKADAAYASQMEIKVGEIAQTESEVKFREKHAASSREILQRLEKLSKTGGVPEDELIKLRLELAESENELSAAQRSLQKNNFERERLEAEHARIHGEAVSELEKTKMRLNALKNDLQSSQQDLLTIRAPYPAVVISLARRNAGGVVQHGQELCQLARIDAKPRARLLLAESGLPKLAIGQQARFSFEAFPYQRYGAVGAKLDWISPSAVSSPEGLHFVALASLDDTAMPGHQRSLPLRVGMKGEARIIVGRRTLIEYAFEPVRQLRENMR